jgi:MFS family permease
MSQEFPMSVNSSRSRAAASPVVAALLPIIVVVFIAYLVIGIALPVLPLHVHEGLGLGTFVVGLIWLAPWSMLALFGAAVTGLGYSLVYPGFGVEAVHSAPSQSRGLAMGAYTAFLDLALGLANPALGLVASGVGLRGVYLVSTLVVLCAAPIALRLLKAPALDMTSRSQDYEQ